jgi:PLP dependent protein
MSSLADRYHRLRSTLPARTQLIAVSKTRTVDEIKALYDVGHRAFGENYPQELTEKRSQLPADIEWHFIGHLQTNKVKLIAPFVHLVHSGDSERLLDELDKRAKALGRSISVLLQVHVAREETKHGFAPEELEGSMSAWKGRWPDLRVEGLMAMASLTEDTALINAEFAMVKGLFDRIRAMGIFPAEHFNRLSMGMSGDLPQALANGSTMVRVGTALFGERPGPVGNT